jgi:hypothetical protein
LAAAAGHKPTLPSTGDHRYHPTTVEDGVRFVRGPYGRSDGLRSSDRSTHADPQELEILTLQLRRELLDLDDVAVDRATGPCRSGRRDWNGTASRAGWVCVQLTLEAPWPSIGSRHFGSAYNTSATAARPFMKEAPISKNAGGKPSHLTDGSLRQSHDRIHALVDGLRRPSDLDNKHSRLGRSLDSCRRILNRAAMTRISPRLLAAIRYPSGVGFPRLAWSPPISTEKYWRM